jgi:DNA end-binding protein Ku
MQQTGKIAVAQVTMRNRQSLAVVRLYEHCLMLETIFYPDEVRPVHQVPALPEANVPLSENELKMARELIENMSTPFEPAKYTDEYRKQLKELIEKKLEGEEIAVSPAIPRANVIDLMQALKESLAATGGPHRLEPDQAASPAQENAGGRGAETADAKEKTASTVTKSLRKKKKPDAKTV